MVRLRTVNNEFSVRGWKVELVKGNGYWYFVGEDVAFTKIESGVYGCGSNLNALSLNEWIEEARRRVKDSRENQP